VRFWRAEHGEHPIAEQVTDTATMASHDVSYRAGVLDHHRAKRLRIEPLTPASLSPRHRRTAQ
jgi:hypothetical protein